MKQKQFYSANVLRKATFWLVKTNILQTANRFEKNFNALQLIKAKSKKKNINSRQLGREKVSFQIGLQLSTQPKN